MAVAVLTDQHKPNHFAFFTPSKSYHLRADSVEDANNWVQELRVAVDVSTKLDLTNKQQDLSSSFKRMGVLESAVNNNTPTIGINGNSNLNNTSPQSSRLKPFNRHSFHPHVTLDNADNTPNHPNNHHEQIDNPASQNQLSDPQRLETVQLGYNSTPTSPLTHPSANTSSPNILDASLNAPKRHSINTMDVNTSSKLGQGLKSVVSGSTTDSASSQSVASRADNNSNNNNNNKNKNNNKNNNNNSTTNTSTNTSDNNADSKSYEPATSPKSSNADYFLSSGHAPSDNLSKNVNGLDDNNSNQDTEKANNSCGSTNNDNILDDSKMVQQGTEKHQQAESKSPEKQIEVPPPQQQQQQKQTKISPQPSTSTSSLPQSSRFDPETEDIIEIGCLVKRRKKYNQWHKVWLVLTTRRILFYKSDPLLSVAGNKASKHSKSSNNSSSSKPSSASKSNSTGSKPTSSSSSQPQQAQPHQAQSSGSNKPVSSPSLSPSPSSPLALSSLNPADSPTNSHSSALPSSPPSPSSPNPQSSSSQPQPPSQPSSTQPSSQYPPLSSLPQPSKTINASHIVDVMELDHPVSKSRNFCMQIITPEKRRQYAANSEEDLIRWIAAIKFVIDGVQGV